MGNVIVVLIILVLLAASCSYIIKEKKKGNACIGCSYASSCGKHGKCNNKS